MKNKILLLLVFASLLVNISKAQIVLDTLFPNYHQLIRLEVSGYKWLNIDNTSHVITLLNMDHSLFKQINYQVDPGTFPSVYYLSEILFNKDSSNIEFLLSYNIYPNNHHYVKIWDEAGNLLFYRDGAMAEPWYGSTFSPNVLNGAISNTDSGAVMILQMDGNPVTTEVYRLPGNIQCSTCYDPFNLHYQPSHNNPNKITSSDVTIKPFPNPSSGNTTIEYSLPEKYKQGKMTILDMNGKLMRAYTIAQQFNNIIIEKGALHAGVYNCIIEAGDQLISKKFIRIE